MATKRQVWFGMKLTPEQKRKIERLAERRGTSQKEAVLEAVQHELDNDAPLKPRPGSFLEAAWDLVGSAEGPPDLSTNPKYMKGFGES